MIRRNAQGQTIRVFTYSSPMRAHGGDRQQHTDETVARLDAIAHRKVEYGCGVRVRKAR